MGFPGIIKLEKLCQACQFGKQTRKLFPKEIKWKATQKLKLIHTDISGVMKTPLLSGSKYYILFIDEFSHSLDLFLKHKLEALKSFTKYKAQVENFTSLGIKTLRTDNGLEYTANEFENFLATFEIHHQLTITYNLQQNGKVKRKNIIIGDMARCLFFQSTLPKKLQIKVINIANYIQNRIIKKALTLKTPFEMWYDHKPSISHFKVYGCVCYARIPKEKIPKFGSKTVITSHIGYSEQSKGYRLYDLESNKVIIYRYVNFYENQYWNREKKSVESLNTLHGINDDQLQFDSDDSSDIEDESKVVRGTRALEDIYNRCNVAITDPTNYAKIEVDENYKRAMDAEIIMIKNNDTWLLVDRYSITM